MVYERLTSKSKTKVKFLNSLESMILAAKEDGCEDSHEITLWIIDRYDFHKSEGYVLTKKAVEEKLS